MQESRETFEEAVELAKLGLAELDAEERLVWLNSSYQSMLGLTASELIGRHWRSAVHTEDYVLTAEAFRRARSEGQASVEIRVVRSDSSIAYQSLMITRVTDDGGVLTGFRTVTHDISGYKGDQEALTLAVESAPSGLLMLNSGGMIQSVNRAVETLFGYQREELIGQKVEMLLPVRVRDWHLGFREASRDSIGLRRDGVEIPLQVYLNKFDTHSGELILCTIIDIAERVDYQQQLELAKQAAESANRAKSDFMSRMSHEIRTPMNLIMGMNALLLESPLTEKQRQHAEISHRNLKRLLRLIEAILDLSKVETGMLTLQAVPFDLSEVINECAASMSSGVEAKGLQFESSIDPDVWLYWIGDGERVQQVLLNLIGNSVKFTARGKIEVRVRSENFGRGEQGLRFEVMDTGCGVPADKTNLIFEVFQQAEESVTRPYEGTGLGLSIAKTLVEMMSGKIWLEESGATGSKFVFTALFPLARKEEVRDRMGSAQSAEQSQALEPDTRILMAEDNPENVILLRAYLDNRSLSLDFARNGAEALRKHQSGEYDLVLMDVQMPVMDGYTATREIRAWEKAQGRRRVPIVALTAHALSGASAESIEAGCDGHLTKPVERDDLIAAIVKFARRSGGRKEKVPQSIATRRPAFLTNRQLDLKNMREALARGDFSSIQTIGHNCKGIGTGYGFPEFSTIGCTVEIAAKALDVAEVEKSIQCFEECVQAAARE